MSILKQSREILLFINWKYKKNKKETYISELNTVRGRRCESARPRIQG